MLGDMAARRLWQVRKAGPTRVRQRAASAGIETVQRDMTILRKVANGSVPEAAARLGVSITTVRRIVRQYGEIAEGILIEDARRNQNDGRSQNNGSQDDPEGAGGPALELRHGQMLR